MSALAAALHLRRAEAGDASRLARLAEHVGGTWNEARFAGSLGGAALGWVIDAAWPGAGPSGPAADCLRPAIAAAIVLQPAPDDWEVLDLAVVPACQRQGLARLLLTHARETATAASASRLMLEVRAGNARAQAVYAAAGFLQIARRQGYYAGSGDSPREDAIVMALQL